MEAALFILGRCHDKVTLCNVMLFRFTFAVLQMNAVSVVVFALCLMFSADVGGYPAPEVRSHHKNTV